MRDSAIVLWGLAVLGTAIPGCQQPVQGPPPDTPEVTAAVAVEKEVRDYADFSGTLTASEVVEIRARVEGYLESVEEYTKRFVARQEKAKAENRALPQSPDGLPIEIQKDFEVRTEDGEGGAGTTVEAGALLFVIDPEPFEVALAAAKAQQTQSQARLDLAEANFKRYEQLLKQEAVTVEEYQRNKASRDVALGQVASDQAAVREAEIELSYTIMRAPFTGRVDRRYVDPGNLVGAGEKTLLTTIRKENPMQVYFDVSEKVVLDLLAWRREKADKPKQRYRIDLKLANEKDFVHEGFIDYIENRVDPATGTALVRAQFPNEEGYLYDGLNVMVRVPGEPVPGAVLVHESAIGTDLGGKYVVVVEPGEGGGEVARFSRVELGTLQGEMRVIRSGIEPGQKYVYEGLQFVRDGSPVTVGETADLSSLLPKTLPESADAQAAPPDRSAEEAAPLERNASDD